MTLNLPQGHVTILFTDVEDSSRINNALRDDIYAKELCEPHFARLRNCVAIHNGHIVGTPSGDSLMVVFQNPDHALACAHAMQESLAHPPLSYTHNDVTYTVRVRIGIHTAQTQIHPQQLDDYSGDDANFAARVASLGAGEQIIAHESVRRDAGAWNRYDWKDWPNRRLKSFDKPETVYELLWDAEARMRENKDVSRGEPGTRWLPDWYRGERNAYIPRVDKEKEILEYFAKKPSNGNPVRMVTLKGFGGMGKTRLGLTCALQCVGMFNGEVYFVRLEDREKSSESVAEAIGTALGLEGEQRLPKNLIPILRDTNALLMLDNYESVHCLDVQKFLCDLLHHTSCLRLLLTGREAVKYGDVEQIVDIDGLTDTEARQLFIARAQLVQSNWQPTTPQEENALSNILCLTERIPLALELVAAGMGDDAYGNVELVAKTLENTPLPSLPDGYISDSSERHESLTRCLDWSYNLLDTDAQDGFARLGLFADSFTPETAEHACGVTNSSKLLTRLAQASLIKRVEPRTDVRYTFLRPTRAYAHDKLNARLNADILRYKYITYYQSITKENGSNKRRNINNANKRYILESEWRNIIGAVEIAERLQEWNSIGYMAANLTDYFDLHSLWSEWLQVGQRAVTAARASDDSQREGAALNNLGTCYVCLGRLDEAVACFKQSLAINREFDNRTGVSCALSNLGAICIMREQLQEALTYWNESLALDRAVGNRSGEGLTLNNIGSIYAKVNYWQGAINCYEQNLAVCLELGDELGQGMTLHNLGNIYDNQGKWNEAVDCYKRSLAISRNLKDQRGEGNTLWNMAVIRAKQNDILGALEIGRQALRVYESTQEVQWVEIARHWIQEWENLV